MLFPVSGRLEAGILGLGNAELPSSRLVDTSPAVARASNSEAEGRWNMSLSVVLIGALVVIGIAVWMFFGGESQSEEESSKGVSTFRCKICGKKWPTFVEAHEHASADHELAGHKIDESIAAE